MSTQPAQTAAPAPGAPAGATAEDDEDLRRPLLSAIPAILLVSLAAGGGAIAWYVAQTDLLGWLRILAAVLVALAVGLLLLAIPIPRRRGPVLRLLALAVLLALLAATVLIVPAAWSHRARGLDGVTRLDLAAIGKGDRVISAPGTGPDSAILVRRAAGPTDVIEAARGRVHRLKTAKDDVVALSADASRAIVVHGETTTVYRLDGAPHKQAELAGVPVSLKRSRLVMHACEKGACEQRGYDLAASRTTPQWAVPDITEDRGPDAAGADLPAPDADPAGLLDVARTTGVLPATTLRFSSDTGWSSVDPVTGETRGAPLAAPDAPCRVVVDPIGTGGAVVAVENGTADTMTICRAPDGAMTAAAADAGTILWATDASPPGEWTVRVEGGRVLATAAPEKGKGTSTTSATEKDPSSAATEGGPPGSREILASAERRPWGAPAGDATAQTGEKKTTTTGKTAGAENADPDTYRVRLGIDGARSVLTTADHRIVALDAATAAPLWSLPLATGRYPARAALDRDTLVVLEPAPRMHPLDPREAVRLRVIDARSGDVVATATLAAYPRDVVPVSGQRALVTDADGTHLVGEG